MTKVAFHRRLSLSLRQLLTAGALVPLAVTLLFAADNLFNLSAVARGGAAAALLLALAAGAARLYWRQWRRPADPARLAVYLEQRHGITDNRLVNAVHFDRDPALPAVIRDLFVLQAESACAGLGMRRVWQHARLAPAARFCGFGLLVFLAYAIPFAPHAKNAFLRFMRPASAVTPLNFTQFAVTPGDAHVLEGDACPVRATAVKFGRPATRLDILVRDGGAPLLYPMRASADGFAFDLRDLARDTRYAIRNGADVSRWHTVSVAPRPRLDRLTVTVAPPAYTGLQPQPLSPARREAEVLRGSRVTVRPGAGDGQRAQLVRDGHAVTGAVDELAFDLLDATTVSADVTDRRGLTHRDVWRCRFAATADRPPEVRFLNRELNVEVAAGHALTLNLDEQDDYGLTALELFTRVNQQERLLKRVDYRERKRARSEVATLAVSEDVFARNASYKVWARVFDNHEPPQAGTVLTPLTLHVAGPAGDRPAGDSADPYVRLFATLTEAHDHQKELRDWIAVRIESDRKERISAVVHKRQQGVHDRITLAATLAADLFRARKIKRGLHDGVAALRAERSEPLLRSLPAIAALDDDRRQAALNETVLRQTEITVELQRLLGLVGLDQAHDARQQERLEEENQDQKLVDALQKLKDDLAKFQADQKRLLDGLEAIDKKDPEDWTDEEEKLLGDLAARQQEWARLFQAAFNDLSKLENQDFSNSFMADELVEMIEELQKSGAALEKKHIEIATVNEELLGEQAESIETNLERWLSDAKDHIKWNGEEGGVFPDVPLQDLPAELTDIIGELIDSVEEMEDVEDSSNSSLSAFDKGIGWGVSDGNMDDMSAKGITGNIMPNNNEVGGRSGEGRSGKSSGQFVEQEATGKGGRDTPTRLVQSPFEKGTVRDTSTDPQGGATGGGKQSGVGGDGLRGITPDQKPDVQQRLPGQQAELKQKAEALLRELNVRNLPTGDLEAAINKMELIQKVRPSGTGLPTRQVRSDLLTSLQDARAAMAAGAAGGTEKSAAAVKRVSTIRHPTHEPTPEGYEASVDAYFRALASPDGE